MGAEFFLYMMQIGEEKKDLSDGAVPLFSTDANHRGLGEPF